MLPDREGRFKATIAEHGVDETGPNNLATFVCKFALTEELVGGQWAPLGPDETSLDITGYFYLEKRDGSINTVTVENLKEAFGWDGRDPLWLQDTDFANLTVQVKLEYETYQGKNGPKTNLKVRYVNAENSTGGSVPKANDNTRKALSTRLGSKLRALAGGTPAATPKPNGKPVAPPAKPKTPATPPASPAGEDGHHAAGVGEVCGRVSAHLAGQGPRGRVVQNPCRAVPGKGTDALTPADWAVVLEQAPAKIIPM